MRTSFKLLLVVLLISIIALGFIGYRQFTLPKTAEMEEFFSRQRAMFKQKNAAILTALSTNTAIASGADKDVGYQWLETEPRPDSYQQGGSVTVRYYTHIRGVGVGAFGTGIAYIDPARKEKIYPTLEDMASDAKKVEGFIGYSHISGNWYSFFWEAD
ncbi:hypothetical protein SAMN02745165_03709 [Malonomonas rubra DSM 5091]|uniref:Uncharacterized protein n=1 Tax=Malonomonas rubra DSM 5091 TaxID=1122189 RepID=A0A1M6NUB8_MALRU|nr:hypothetical protein [Malonomonas rubra]SHJ99305.1 hypothetical protein SAMN02745165_03709 [Malonomonas rubra DSM 5091]